MANWIIRDRGSWVVRLADCGRKHAESVLAQLEANPDLPGALVLDEVGEDFEPLTTQRRRLFRRRK